MTKQSHNCQINKTLRIGGLAALMVCTGWPAKSSFAPGHLDQRRLNQHQQAPLTRMSTDLPVYRKNDHSSAAGPGYLWQNIAPDVLNLSYNNTLPPQPSFATQGGTASPAPAPSQFAPDPLSLSLTGQSGEIRDAPHSLGSSVPATWLSGEGRGPSRLGDGFRSAQVVDPSQLQAQGPEGPFQPAELKSDGYDSLLGLNTGGRSVNRASVAALLDRSQGQNTLPDPLGPADFVTLGHLTQTAALKFFQMARAASGDDLAGPDEENEGQTGNQFTSTVISLSNLNSPYLFASIRDQWASQTGQYNTVVIALNFGRINAPTLCATPEPSLWLILAGFMAVVLVAKRCLPGRANSTAN